MKDEDCKLPIQEDYKCFLNNGKREVPRHRKLFIFAGFLLLVAMSIMIAFTFRSVHEIAELRQEIEAIKSSLKILQKTIGEDQYDDFYMDPEDIDDQKTFKVYDKNEDDDDDGIDYYNYDDSYNDDDSEEEYNEELPNDVYLNNIKRVMIGEDFTKDAKDTTAPPRTKRSIIGYTEDGVPINSESFAEARRRNITVRRNRHHLTTSPPSSSYSHPYYPPMEIHQETDVSQISSTPRPAYPRRLRLMHQENKSKSSHPSVKKFLKSGDSGENPDVEFTIVRDGHVGGTRTRHRQRRLELDDRFPRTGRMRPLPTAHFSGDTSKYVLGQHDNFNGNGHLRHLQRTYVDWMESSWFRTLGMDRHFSLSDGILTIKEPGLYFIYAQIYYYDEHDTNGFRVYKNENVTLLQCTTTTHSVDRVMKSNTCFTAAAEYLHENDRISLGDLAESRYSLFEPGKSFFGVIKLGDVKIK